MCAQILTMDPFPSIPKVFALAIQEERQRALSPNQFLPIPKMISNVLTNNLGSINVLQGANNRQSAGKSNRDKYY